MISFRLIVLLIFFLLVLLRLKFLKPDQDNTHGCYIDASIFFWTILLFFFADAIIKNKYMVPGDILYNYYPWKAFAHGKSPHNPLLTDITGCVYPWLTEIKTSLLQFHLPLWNRYAYCGCPLAGNQVSAAFHPFNFFLYFMSAPDAATLFPFLRLFIAGMGGFALLKSWNLSRGASIFGSTLFCFCGVHVSWLSNYPEVSVTMLIPWIFLSIDKIAYSGSFKWWVILILLSVLQFLGGHCETSFHVYTWAVPFFFFRLYRERIVSSLDIRTAVSRTGMLITSGIFSLGITSFQLFPFLEYLPLSTRMHAIAAHKANLFIGLNFIKVVTTVTATMITPDFFGNPVAGNYWGSFNYIEQNAYITITGLFLALMAFNNKYHKNNQTQVTGITTKDIISNTSFIKYYFLWGGILAYLIAVRTPVLFDFIVSLPLFRQNSNHRLIIIAAFSLSVLAAFAVNDIEVYGISNKKWIFIIALTLITISFILFRFDVSSLTSEQFRYRLIHIGYSFVFLIVIFCLLYFGSYQPPIGADKPRIRAHISVLTTGVALIEIFVWGWNFNTFVTKKNIFPSTPLINFLQSRKGKFRVAALPGTLPAGTEQIFKFDSITGLDPMKSHNYEKIYAEITGKYDSINSWNPDSFESPWINFLNVRYIAAPPGTTKKQLHNKNLCRVYKGLDGVVFKNQKAFNRVFRLSKIVYTDNHENALKLVKQYQNVLDKVAIVESREKNEELTYASNKSRPEIIEEKNNYIKMNFQGLPGGMYINSQQYYPGWKLRIDGRPALLLRTDYAFIGFWVPNNTKTVELYYSPLSFKAGVLVSFLFILCLICLIFFYNRREADLVNK